jgi:hypothetical protein
LSDHFVVTHCDFRTNVNRRSGAGLGSVSEWVSPCNRPFGVASTLAYANERTSSGHAMTGGGDVHWHQGSPTLITNKQQRPAASLLRTKLSY